MIPRSVLLWCPASVGNVGARLFLHRRYFKLLRFLLSLKRHSTAHMLLISMLTLLCHTLFYFYHPASSEDLCPRVLYEYLKLSSSSDCLLLISGLLLKYWLGDLSLLYMANAVSAFQFSSLVPVHFCCVMPVYPFGAFVPFWGKQFFPGN